MTKAADSYRQCAAIAVFRATEELQADGQPVYELLILHKPRKRDAWQLPQGGVEAGESVQQAALRELKEEASIAVTPLGLSKECYQYDFPKSYRRFRPDHVCGQCVRFMFGLKENSLPIHVDGKEIDAYAWIQPSELRKYVSRKEYLAVAEEVIAEGLALLSRASGSQD